MSRLQAFLKRLRKEKKIEVIWKNKDYDLPVTVCKFLGSHDGDHYFNVLGSSSSIPFSEIYFKEE